MHSLRACSRDHALRVHSCAITQQGFYRLVQRVNNDARVLRDLWRIKRKCYMKEEALHLCAARTREMLRTQRLFAIAWHSESACWYWTFYSKLKEWNVKHFWNVCIVHAVLLNSYTNNFQSNGIDEIEILHLKIRRWQFFSNLYLYSWIFYKQLVCVCVCVCQALSLHRFKLSCSPCHRFKTML